MEGPVTQPSPNRIPHRTSSMGFQSPPSKYALRPLAEDPWTSQETYKSPKMNGHASPIARRTNGTNHERQQPSFGSDLIDVESRHWPEAKEKVLMGPYDYMESHPGKDIRSQLVAAFNVWLKVPRESLDVITKVVGMLHTSSLLVDDVEDGSQLRRGVPVAHAIFGVPQTINSANYVYFRALEELQKLNNAHTIRIFTEELLNLHRGQGMDLWWRDTLTCPTEAEYLEMVDNKTGGLFRLAVKLMQAESSTGQNCVPLVNAVGLLFQILDDYKNLSSTVYTQNKGLAEDLTEGKFSFPIIHCIRSDPANQILINILKQKPEDHQIKRYAISHMESTGSFAYTRGRLRELTARALQLVDEMESHSEAGSGRAIRSILEKMSVDNEESIGAKEQQS